MSFTVLPGRRCWRRHWGCFSRVGGLWRWICPTQGLLGWPQQWFIQLFETDTAVDFLTSNLSADLSMTGYGSVVVETLSMGSLQLVTARKPFLAPVS